MGRLRNYGLISEAVMIALFILALVLGSSFWTGVVSVFLAVVTLLNLAGALLKNKMFRAIGKTFIGNNATFISHLKLATLENLLMNRAKSVIMMSSEVFLKRMRSMNYENVYEDKKWRNRAVTSTVYALRPGERWESRRDKGTLPAELVPSEAVQQNSEIAADFGTTLWFTAADKAAGKPAALFAAGQYTVCYSLLSYINKIEKDHTNLNSAHAAIIAIKPQLQSAWQQFQKNPQWMVPKV